MKQDNKKLEREWRDVLGEKKKHQLRTQEEKEAQRAMEDFYRHLEEDEWNRFRSE